MLDLKLLYRDWRGGQLNLVISALVLAVMTVTAVSLLADRVENGLNAQISSFLAADKVVQGNRAIRKEVHEFARELNLATARITLLRSMVFADDKNHLAAVKSVDNQYPLRGKILVTGRLNIDMSESSNNGPPPGEAWVEARLLSLLDIKLGDELELGYTNLPVTRIILNEPDRGTGFAMTGARVMIHEEDLENARLLRPGSRATHRLLLAGSPQQLSDFAQWYTDQEENDLTLATHYRLRSAEQSEESLGEALQRGRSFLLLSGTIGVLLAGLAMALASQRYADRLTDQIALMKAWGQSAWWVRRSQLVRLFILTLVATLLGMLCGWLAHYVLLIVAEGLFDAQLPAASWRPWIIACVTGFTCTLGFALPALWHLPTIAPLRVLRRNLPSSVLGQGRRLGIGIAALLALAWWYSQSWLMASLFLAALLSLFGVCALVAFYALKLVKRFGVWQGSFIRLGLANLWRRRAHTLIQLVGFSVTLMLLLISIGTRTSLISQWQAQLPEDAPSHFVLNVADTELDEVKIALRNSNVKAENWYPMVRGRLVSLNGELLSQEHLLRSEGLAREVNFTQTNILPDNNEIVDGNWFGDDPQKPQSDVHAFSIEQEVAAEMGLAIGDLVEFSIGGIPLHAKLTSIRTVNWENMQANFYIIFSPGALDKFAPNWMSSVRSDFVPNPNPRYHQQAPFITTLIKQHPTVLVLELSEIIERIRTVIDRVTLGLEMILLLVLACGGLVLFAAIGVSYDERLRENAVLRTLGSPRHIIAGALTTEFAVLGAIAGIIAAAGAEVVLHLLKTEVFELSPDWHWEIWLIGLGAGIFIITLLGLLRSREIISVPPLHSLRQID